MRYKTDSPEEIKQRPSGVSIERPRVLVHLGLRRTGNLPPSVPGSTWDEIYNFRSRARESWVLVWGTPLSPLIGSIGTWQDGVKSRKEDIGLRGSGWPRTFDSGPPSGSGVLDVGRRETLIWPENTSGSVSFLVRMKGPKRTPSDVTLSIVTPSLLSG